MALTISLVVAGTSLAVRDIGLDNKLNYDRVGEKIVIGDLVCSGANCKVSVSSDIMGIEVGIKKYKHICTELKNGTKSCRIEEKTSSELIKERDAKVKEALENMADKGYEEKSVTKISDGFIVDTGGKE